jgi:hypothetical protein
MAIPRTKDEFILSLKQKLGYPRIPIHITDEQFNQIIEETLMFYSLNVYDGQKDVFFKLQTEAGVYSYEIDSVPNLFAVTDILPNSFFNFPYSSKYGVTDEMVEFFSQIESMQTGGIINATIALQNLNLFKKQFLPKMSWSFNYNDSTLTFNSDPLGNHFGIFGSQLIDVEGTSGEDTGSNTNLWNNHIVKQYALALAKIQLGFSLGGALYSTVEGPGGISIDLERIISQGQEEKRQIEEDVAENYGQNFFQIHIG